ncbi:hypothetical protein [Erwinia amylovora]|uniref:hypothetical protein n=1 Tax=Erwinia amylovora TaxID=552 RepID=UPI00211DD0FC|nr:hypothetical protein [Erwinia amylovora]
MAVPEGAALPAAPAGRIVAALLVQRALAAPGFTVQAVTGELAHRLPIPASREERRLRALEQQLKAQQ